MNLEIKNKKTPFNDFKRIAEELLNGHVLIVGESRYRFTTLEFYYLNEEDNHADVYSHKHDRQTTSGQWYFHGSGLDITFGSNGVYGGILIRGVKNLRGNKFINGPLLCVQEIFKNLGAIDNKEKSSFYIQELPLDKPELPIDDQKIYYSRRVGLNQKIDTSEDARFYNGLYRFFINPKETQKDKGNIAVDLLTQGYTEKEINTLFDYRHFK